MSSPTLDGSFPFDFERNFRFQEGGRLLMPEWATALIKLGWWCRSRHVPGKRILAIALLPSRAMASSLVGFGAVIGSAQQSKPGLTWDRLRTLPAGTELFWRWTADSKSARGVIQVPDEGMEHLVRVLLTAGSKKNMTWSFSEETFHTGAFSDEKLPSGNRLGADAEAKQLLEEIGIVADSRWFSSGSPEAALVTSCADFSRSLADVRVVSGAKSAMFSSLLFASVFRDGCSSKLQVVPVNSNSERDTPLRILDGAHAFRRLRDSGGADSNVIVLLDRGEVGPELSDDLLRITGPLGSLTEELQLEVSDLAQRLDVSIQLAEVDG